MTPIAGILLPPDTHHLDHLAPLCSLLNVPLILSTQTQQRLSSAFYPDLLTLPLESVEAIVEKFDTLITSTARPLFDQTFFFAQHLVGKEIKTLWCPHGNSDKGRLSTFMEGLKEEKQLLIYGSLMSEFLKEKGVTARQIPVGNYRLAYFEKHRTFYEKLLPPLQNAPTLLWAPTWNDQEKSSSFPKAMSPLLKNLPDSWQLLIKLHPHLYEQFEVKTSALKTSIENRPNIHLIKEFPPIYPLLEKVDLYIGDRSSIGYDFLAFDRPMCFFDRRSKKLPLLSCGPTLTLKNLYETITEELNNPQRHAPQRQELYKRTFDECKADLHSFLL